MVAIEERLERRLDRRGNLNGNATRRVVHRTAVHWAMACNQAKGRKKGERLNRRRISCLLTLLLSSAHSFRCSLSLLLSFLPFSSLLLPPSLFSFFFCFSTASLSLCLPTTTIQGVSVISTVLRSFSSHSNCSPNEAHPSGLHGTNWK